MPQMAPLNWLTLFFFFFFMFMMFNMLNYFSFMYKVKKDSIKKQTLKYNWKW